MSGFNAGAIDPALLSGGLVNPLMNLNQDTINANNNSNMNENSGMIGNQNIQNQSNSHSNFQISSSNSLLSSINDNSSSSGIISSPNLTQFSNLNHSYTSLNQPPSSSPSMPQNNSNRTAASTLNPSFSNGVPQTDGGPNNSDPFFLNGMPAKEHEMHQKDQELSHFLLKMEEYKPIVPDEVAKYYLEKVGFECNDVKVQRLLVLACQKFVSDIAQDAFSYARTRAGQAPGGRQGPLAPNSNSAGLSNGLPNNPGARKDRTRTVLTQEDLAQALAEYGINASRAPYYL